MATVRLATVKADGSRYIVQSVTVSRRGPGTVVCWGEVRSYKSSGAATHEPSKVLRRDAVVIEDVERTPELLEALWQQCIAAHRAAGDKVRMTRGGNAVIDRE